MNTSPSVKTAPDLRVELDRLKARLAQGRRDHARSRDELHRLEGEIREAEGELRVLHARELTATSPNR